MKKKNYSAFTLAEVLITLTIIGVIAALTIPNLMQSYRKHVAETGVKEAYSILSNAIKMAEAEKGQFLDWSTSGVHSASHKEGADYVMPYIKYVRTCDYWTNQCFPLKIKDIADKEFAPHADWNKYVLQNGMYLAVGTGIYAVWGGIQINFLVDINGVKGPNKMGVDIFQYTLRYNNYAGREASGYGKQYFEAGLLSIWPMIGKSHPEGRDSNSLYSSDELLGSSLSGACNVDAPSSATNLAGARCAAVIQRNGWKIPDNYPVKKW